MRVSTNSSKRLVYQWPSPDWVSVLATWTVCWFFITLGIGLATASAHHQQWWWLDTLFTSVTLGPPGVAGVVVGVAWLWRNPPFRIESE